MRRRFRLVSVLRVARLREQLQAQEAAARARDEAAAADEAAARAEAAAPARDEEVAVAQPVEAADFLAGQQRAHLRATAAVDAAGAHEEAMRLLASARAQWHDAVRRRRSLEELEARHQTMYAVFAARAAQRALDDLVRTRRPR